ncbi:Uncharacterised protein [Streptococcus pneumoniae]|nr:Uncharacterised protein [Streptococcus pneumoniae]
MTVGIIKKAFELILSPLGRQCEKDHVYTWILHYYLEGIFHGQKRYNI